MAQRSDQLKIPNYLGKWIKAYLADRTFKVKSGSALSSTKAIQTGVPQGSVLGLIFFALYLNDRRDSTAGIALDEISSKASHVEPYYF